jgi:hypothetical protein
MDNEAECPECGEVECLKKCCGCCADCCDCGPLQREENWFDGDDSDSQEW